MERMRCGIRKRIYADGRRRRRWRLVEVEQ
jgi:hypothetical protein